MLVPPRPGPAAIDGFIADLPAGGLSTLRFHYHGKSREQVVTVTLRAEAMRGLLEAMKVSPTIQVTASTEYANSGSLRSGGPCAGHDEGWALDAFHPMPSERRALLGSGFGGATSGDDPHFTFAR